MQEALMAKAERGATEDSSEDADVVLARIHERQGKTHRTLREEHLKLMAQLLELEKALDEIE